MWGTVSQFAIATELRAGVEKSASGGSGQDGFSAVFDDLTGEEGVPDGSIHLEEEVSFSAVNGNETPVEAETQADTLVSDDDSTSIEAQSLVSVAEGGSPKVSSDGQLSPQDDVKLLSSPKASLIDLTEPDAREEQIEGELRSRKPSQLGMVLQSHLGLAPVENDFIILTTPSLSNPMQADQAETQSIARQGESELSNGVSTQVGMIVQSHSDPESLEPFNQVSSGSTDPRKAQNPVQSDGRGYGQQVEKRLNDFQVQEINHLISGGNFDAQEEKLISADERMQIRRQTRPETDSSILNPSAGKQDKLLESNLLPKSGMPVDAPIVVKRSPQTSKVGAKSEMSDGKTVSLATNGFQVQTGNSDSRGAETINASISTPKLDNDVAQLAGETKSAVRNSRSPEGRAVRAGYSEVQVSGAGTSAVKSENEGARRLIEPWRVTEPADENLRQQANRPERGAPQAAQSTSMSGSELKHQKFDSEFSQDPKIRGSERASSFDGNKNQSLAENSPKLNLAVTDRGSNPVSREISSARLISMQAGAKSFPDFLENVPRPLEGEESTSNKGGLANSSMQIAPSGATVFGTQGVVPGELNVLPLVQTSLSKSELKFSDLRNSTKVISSTENKTPGNTSTGSLMPQSVYDIPKEVSPFTLTDPLQEPKGVSLEGSIGPARTEPRNDLAVSHRTTGPISIPSLVNPIRTALQQGNVAAMGDVEVELSPAELGRVRLSFSATDVGINVLVIADRSETVDIVRRHLSLLTEDLRNNGFDNVSVDVQTGQSGNPSGQGNDSEASDATLMEASLDTDSDERHAANVQPNTTSSAVDLRL